METADVTEMFENIYMDVVEDIIVESIPEGAFVDQWDVDGLEIKLKEQFDLTIKLSDFIKKDGILETEIRDIILKDVQNSLESKKEKLANKLLKLFKNRFYFKLSIIVGQDILPR